jgi:hypothetical protein
MIPDGNPAGVEDVRNITSPIRRISEVRVQVRIAAATNSFAFNGDVYAYLHHNDGHTVHISVLLNRVGRTTSNTNGYGDDGFDVMFADVASHDIHNYRLYTNLTAGTALTGLWQPDGRFVDPSLVTSNSARTAPLSTLNGMDAQGEWTLFLADLDPGGEQVLQSWTLQIQGAVAPAITWTNPAPILYGTLLGSTQLNATADVPGTFQYVPPAGSRLPAGLGQALTAIFRPTDTNAYVEVTNTVTIDVLPRALVVTPADTNRTYGGADPVFTGTVVGVQDGDLITAQFSTTASATSPVGPYPITAALEDPANQLGNYAVTAQTGTLTVTPAPLLVTAGSTNRPYRTANPALTGQVTGLRNGESLSPLWQTTATLSSAAGSYPIAAVLTGLETILGNYLVTTQPGILTVDPAALGVAGIVANNKVYDATATAALNLGAAVLVGVAAGDTVSLVTTGATGHFADPRAGTGKAVQVQGLGLSGPDAGSYTLTVPAVTADITPLPLTLTGISVDNKVYDGSTAAMLHPGGAVLVGVLAADAVSFKTNGTAATFADKNVGTGKAVQVQGLGLCGPDAGNYTLSVPALAADITPAPLSTTGISVDSKVYDGTAAAELHLEGAGLAGVVAPDVVSLTTNPTPRAVYDNTANDLALRFDLGGLEAGDEIILDRDAVQLSRFSFEFWGEGAGGGPFAGNVQVRVRFYRNDGPLSDLGYPAPGTVLYDSGGFPISATPRATLVYQGEDFTGQALVPLTHPLPQSFTWSVQFTGLGPGDAAGVDLYSPPTVGLNYTDYWENDYWLNGTNGWVLKINPIGSIDFAARFETLSAPYAHFADKHAGTGKPVQVEGLALAGPDAGNYTLPPPTVAADITPAPLLATNISANDKAYDGTDRAALNLAGAVLIGRLAGDEVTLVTSNASGTFPNANAAPDKTVQVGGLALGGASAGDYSVTAPAATASIVPAPATVIAQDASRSYGDPNPVFTGSVLGLFGEDTLPILYGTSATTNSAVGTYAIVPTLGDSRSTIPISAANYTVALSNGTLTVTPQPLTVTPDNAARPYAAPNPAFTGRVTGLRNGDPINASYATSADAGSGAGPYPIVATLSDPENLLPNYSVTTDLGTLTICKATTHGVLLSAPNPALPGATVNFTATVAVQPPSTATATGAVQLQVDGVSFGAPMPLAAGTAALAVNSLPPGQHTVGAVYGGDANLAGSTAALTPPELINTPPLAGAQVLEYAPGHVTWFSTANLISSASDPEGNPITFVAVARQSAGGATLTVLQDSIYYSPPPGFTNADTFTYTIADSWGAQSTGTVTVVMLPGSDLRPTLQLLAVGEADFRLQFTGIPWTYYTVEFAPSLPTIDWQVLGYAVADSTGMVVFDDTPPAGTRSRFYRVHYPDSSSIGATMLILEASANPSPPGAPVTLSAGVVPLDPGHGLPTGFVQFKVDGSAFGPRVALDAGHALLITANLTQGPHIVEAEYAGDGPFSAAAGGLNQPLMIDTPPTAATATFYRFANGGTKINVLQLLENVSDADGDPITLDSVAPTSAEGGTLLLADGWIFYTPPAGFAGSDSFSYVVRDSFGVGTSATVDIVATVANEPAANLLIQDLGGGSYHLSFSGIPWRQYEIQFTADLNAPDWQPLSTVTADSHGHFDVYDQLPPEASSRYYRSIYDAQLPFSSPFRLATWINFIANTNGRSMDLWLERTHPAGWPDTPPVLVWNPNSLVYGLDGFTAISQCNEFEGPPGQDPVTLLTRRHGYMRGHGVTDVHGVILTNGLTGRRVWFCSSNNTVIQMTIAASLTHVDWINGTYYDYTVVSFTEDAPASITPISVISDTDYATYYYDSPDIPFLTLGTEQDGHVATLGTSIEPFVYNLFKGGDSGSPNLIPAPDNKLIMISGRTTSGASSQMQADMDALSLQLGLNPGDYPLHWYDFSAWEP